MSKISDKVQAELDNILKKNNWKSIKDIDWDWISYKEILSEEFIEEFQDKINWLYVSIKQTLSEELIEKRKDKLHWIGISECQTLSEEFIEKYQDKVNWENIPDKQTLSEEFIEKYKNKVNLRNTLYNEILSIGKFQDKVNWKIKLIDIGYQYINLCQKNLLKNIKIKLISIIYHIRIKTSKLIKRIYN